MMRSFFEHIDGGCQIDPPTQFAVIGAAIVATGGVITDLAQDTRHLEMAPITNLTEVGSNIRVFIVT